MNRLSGYSSKKINAGDEIQNKGFEVMLNSDIINNGSFIWNMNVNYSQNKNTINALYENLTTYKLGGFDNVLINAVVGERYGAIYGTKFKRSMVDSEVEFFSGILRQPYKRTGLAEITAPGGKRDKFVVDGVVADGNGYKVNTTETTQQRYWTAVGTLTSGNFGITEQNVYDATNVRLRNVQISYNFPKSMFENSVIKSAKVSVSANNVWMIYSKAKGVDPESVFALSSNAVGFENFALPTIQSKNPEFNSQKEVYYFMLAELKDAVAKIDVNTKGPDAKFDLAYGYDWNKWIRYANSMRMRLAMRMSEVDPAKAKSEFEEAENWGVKGQRNGLIGLAGRSPGLGQQYRNSSNSRIFFASWESYFLIAEAALKGWATPMSDEAAYNKGIQDSFAYNNVSGFYGQYIASTDYNRDAGATLTAVSCDRNDTQIVNDQDTIALVTEAKVSFSKGNNYQVYEGFIKNIPKGDNVYVYRLEGVTNDGRDIWQPLPRTFYAYQFGWGRLANKLIY
ncbi:hypothetical protein FQR65_LT15296 [Abscondita terminalis]|nr:hypothetical protein FQR65_LT15296 [Abscondita terminalis]